MWLLTDLPYPGLLEIKQNDSAIGPILFALEVMKSEVNVPDKGLQMF